MLQFIVYSVGLWIIGFRTWRDRISPWMRATNDSVITVILILSILLALVFLPGMFEGGAWVAGLPLTCAIWFALLFAVESSRRSQAREAAKHAEFISRMRTSISAEPKEAEQANAETEAQLPWYLRTETSRATLLEMIKSDAGKEPEAPLEPEDASRYGVKGMTAAETAKAIEEAHELEAERLAAQEAQKPSLAAKAQTLSEIWRMKGETGNTAGAAQASAARTKQRPVQQRLPSRPEQSRAAAQPATQAAPAAEPGQPAVAAAPAPTAPTTVLPTAPLAAPSHLGVKSRFASPASAPPPKPAPPLPPATPAPAAASHTDIKVPAGTAPTTAETPAAPASPASAPARFSYQPRLVDSKLGGKPAPK